MRPLDFTVLADLVAAFMVILTRIQCIDGDIVIFILPWFHGKGSQASMATLLGVEWNIFSVTTNAN